MMKVIFAQVIILFCLLCEFINAYADPIPMIAQLCQADTADNFGGNIESAGDFNDDGFRDIWILRNFYEMPLWGKSSLYLYYGGNPMDTIPDMVISDTFYTIVNVGQINEDKYDDFIISWYKGGIKYYGLHYGGPLFDIIPVMKFPVHNQANINMGHQGSVCGGFDMDGDGKNDLILGEPGGGIGYVGSAYFYSGSPEMDTIFDLEFLGHGEFPEYYDYGMAVEFIENLDGNDYIAISQVGNGIYETFGRVFLYGDVNKLDTIPEFIIGTPWRDTSHNHVFGNNLSNIGDIDADGYSDLLIGTMGSTDAYIFFGEYPFDTEYDIMIGPTLDYHELIGDVNNDTYPDIMGAQGMFNGVAWILYGGPSVDGIFDVAVDRPSGITQFGRAFKGLGDVNGDSIDDFAVAGLLNETNYVPGVVTVFSGYDGDPLQAIEDNRDILPKGYKLYQNYPNPFNAVTMINFSIPVDGDCVLEIYNILGRKIFSKEYLSLSKGQNSIMIDNSMTKLLSSGIYLYKLGFGNEILSRKMMLLK